MLIDHYLSRYHYSEYHQIDIACAPDRVFPAIRRVDFRNSRLIDLLFRIRGIPGRMRKLDDFLEFGFVMLEEQPSNEMVLGFLLEKGTLAPVEAGAYREATLRLPVCGAWNFRIRQTGEGVTLSTETRVLCGSRISRILFSTYWFVVRPFSGLVRIAMLKLIREEAERS